MKIDSLGKQWYVLQLQVHLFLVFCLFLWNDWRKDFGEKQVISVIMTQDLVKKKLKIDNSIFLSEFSQATKSVEKDLLNI